MSRDTAALYFDLSNVTSDTRYVVQRDGFTLQMTAGELLAALVPVPPAPVPAPTHKLYTVTTDTLNVRNGPNIKAGIIEQVHSGDTLTVVEEGNGWLRLGGSIIKWVSAAYTRPYVAPVAPVPPAPTPTPVPPVVVVPAPVAVGGYGRHYLGTPSDAELTADHYPIAKAVDQPAALQKLHNHVSNAMYIYRRYLSFDEQDRRLRLMASDMQGALNQWFAEMEPYLVSMPWAYFESLNEVDAPPQFVEFERLRTLRLAQRGIKSCVLNLSVARSDKAMWARCKGLVDAVIASNGIIGEHSYGMGLISNNCGDSYVDLAGNWHGELFPTNVNPDSCWTGLRIMQSRKALAAQGQGAAVLVATELGLGNTADLKNGRPGLLHVITNGWRDCIPLWQHLGWLNGTTAEAFYREQLDWWAKTTGCMGTVFTFGTGSDSQWNKDDTRGVL
jgi:hypothetical protein